MRLRILLSFSLLSLLPVIALAQPDPMKWGKVSPEELAMKDFPADTNAAAVILADYGTVEFDRDWGVLYKHHRRIKILKESGYDWGTAEISYVAADRVQSVRAVRGQTLKAGPDGKTVITKLDKKSIFDEKLGTDYRIVKFTLPALEPGAIVEYSYTVYSSSPAYLPAWEFQLGEPVIHSEFRFEFPGQMAFVRAARGVLAFDIEEETPLHRPYGPAQLNRWVMKDVPALRKEPYMTAAKDYRAGLEFQLSSITVPGEVIKILQTWPELAKRLNEMPEFGKQLEAGRAVRGKVEEITAGVQDPTEKMQKIYDFIRTTIKWDDWYGIFADRDPATILKTQTGSSAEIALLLCSMLREAGLKADPVLISTRDHGRIVDEYPLYRQFNDVLVQVQAGGSTWLLSANDPYRGYDLLPEDALNGRGWLVGTGEAVWVPITTKGRWRHMTSVEATLDSTGTLSGRYLGNEADYSALDSRHDIKETNDNNKYVKDAILADLKEATIDSVSIENLDDVSEPLSISAKFSTPEYAQVNGDFIYLNPTVADRLEENPFKMPERTFPVNIGYPVENTFVLKLKIPAGYQVLEKPGNLNLNLTAGGATFVRTIEVNGDVLSMQTRLILGKPIFENRQYAELREFHNRVMNAHAEQIVLKKAETVSTQ